MLDLTFLTPKRVRYNSEKAFQFPLWLNIIFAFSATFTVANLYYCQPILNQLAHTFNVSNEEIGKVPTLTQAGYATGLLLISPLGDLVERRPLILTLVLCSASLCLGLSRCNSLASFQAISFLMGAVTVTPQVLLPLVGDLAPPERRAACMSIVSSGLLFGILLARVFSGLIEYLSDWRVIYYFGCSVQYFILFVLYWFLPDYQRKKSHGLGYFGILKSMFFMLFKYPLLIQCSLIGTLVQASFIGFWVTSTFLLGGTPFFYNSLEIGLFGLVGMAGVMLAPFVGRYVDKLVPWFASIVGLSFILCGQLVGFGGKYNVVPVVLQIFIMDFGQITQQLANQVRIFSIDPAARSRLNAIYIIFLFIGQTTGSGVGTIVMNRYGWLASQGVSVGYVCTAILIALSRGPFCRSWVGWEGGFAIRKKAPAAVEQSGEPTVEKSTVASDVKTDTKTTNALEETETEQVEEIA